MRSAKITTTGPEATRALGSALGRLARPGDVILLSGDLGAGKTQFVKGLALGLEVEEPVTSPTFNILLVHEGRLRLNHIDLYRLEKSEQLEDIDYFGTLESGGVTAVEWGDRFRAAAPDGYLSLTFCIVSDEERLIEAASEGERGADLLGLLGVECEGIAGVRFEGGER